MSRILFLMFLIPLLSKSQIKISDAGASGGIAFEESLNWDQIIEKAGKENKMIFVDCYATWCGPCKMMDRDIYPGKLVGEYFNSHFISVKIQFDSTLKDNDRTRSWYSEAHALQQQYKIMVMPSYLFFSPAGKIVHRDIGQKNEPDFIKLGKNAFDPTKQYYTLIDNYKNGKIDYSVLHYLAISAKTFKETELAQQIAEEFINNYLEKLPDSSFCKSDHFEFIDIFSSTLLNSREKAFRLYFYYPGKVDTIMGNGYASRHVEFIINKEEIQPLVNMSKKGGPDPNWDSLYVTIKYKYGDHYAESTILNGKISWFGYKKDWENLVKYNVEKIDRDGLDTTGIDWAVSNNMIWDVIFTHSSDKRVLEKAVSWMEIILTIQPNDPPSIDTYANLLYKLGRIRKAITWEKKAQKLELENSIKENREPENVYTQTLEKMQKGTKTWEN